MKTRQAFVANSSSSSFLVVSLGSKEIVDAGYGRDRHEESSTSIDIDKMLTELEEAKAKGVTEVKFTFGGGYDG